MGLGSGIREKTYSGSRIQGSKRHRIPDPDPQHCKNQEENYFKQIFGPFSKSATLLKGTVLSSEMNLAESGLIS